MELTEKNSVGEWVREYPHAREIFNREGIDFCCGGEKPLEKACQEKGIEPEKIISEILDSPREATATLRVENWSLPLLCDYIIENHHSYVRKMLPELDEKLKKIQAVHEDEHPELKEVYQLFSQIRDELYEHMEKEEKIGFPSIKQGNLDREMIEDHIQEHQEAGKKFKKIVSLTNDFSVPSEACETYRYTFEKLKEFWEDLQWHIHLENNVLFPRAGLGEK